MTEQLNLFAQLPSVLAGWTAFLDSGRIIVRHEASGCRATFTSTAEAEAWRAAAAHWLDVLASLGWRVFYDPSALHVSSLHAWTATHESEPPVSGATADELALRGWRCSIDPYDLPDVPDDVLDALFLAGWTWEPRERAYRKGSERLSADTLSDGELRYIAQTERF